MKMFIINIELIGSSKKVNIVPVYKSGHYVLEGITGCYDVSAAIVSRAVNGYKCMM